MLSNEEIDRFWSKVVRGPGCWTRGKGTKWYVVFAVRRGSKVQNFLGHRIAYQDAVGPIPDGMTLLHLCDNIRCVRPSHLRPGTKADNNADMIAKGRNWQASVTHCPAGHEYTPENSLYHNKAKRTGLHCRTCHNARRLGLYYSRKATR